METKGILKVLSSSKQNNMLIILRTVFAAFASNGIFNFYFLKSFLVFGRIFTFFWEKIFNLDFS